MQTLSTAKRHLIAVALGIAAATTAAHADEADARQLVKAMSDYLGAQERIAFDYDATLDVVTSEGEKFGIASSGVTTLERPDHLFATRTGGFANVEMVFDGTTLTLVGRNAGVFTRVAAPGSIDQLLDSLQTDYGLVMPAADLLLSAPYDVLMEGVVEVKDLGEDQWQRQLLTHREVQRQQAEEVVGLAAEFGDEAEHAVAKQQGARHRGKTMGAWETGKTTGSGIAFCSLYSQRRR